MIPNIPTLGVRFDITKIDSATYGLECWKIFWRVVDIGGLRGALLFEGDTAATLTGKENVFCIAVQTTDTTVLREIRGRLGQSAEFQKVAAHPEFAEGHAMAGEPLPGAGRIDAAGNLVDAFWSRSALDAVRREKPAAAD